MKSLVKRLVHSALSFGTCVLLTVSANAAPKAAGKTSSNWIIYSHGSSWSFKGASAPMSATSIASFLIPNSLKTVPTFLTSAQSALTGNLSGKTLFATFDISGSSPLTYYGAGTSWNSCGGTPANARFVITTNATGYNLGDSSSSSGANKYWWSNPISVNLVNAQTLSISALVTPSLWSNGLGKVGSSTPDAFNAAASQIRQVGLSFSGGCFFDMGIATIGTTSTFYLRDFRVM